MVLDTDYGHPERAFFQKFETFGLGQTNWAEILWGILGISGQTISTILAQWVPCPWERVAGSLSYKKLWFLGLKHTTPKSSQNKILAVKNLWNTVRTSVFGGVRYAKILSFEVPFLPKIAFSFVLPTYTSISQKLACLPTWKVICNICIMYA
jgi:hypothetical protein